MSALTRTPAWMALQAHARTLRGIRTLELFERDARRAQRFAINAAGLYLDYSKQRLTDETLALLLDLAHQQGLEPGIARLFAGDETNPTEHRAALHMALRAPAGSVYTDHGQPVMAEVDAVRQRLYDFARSVRDGSWRGVSGEPIRDIVNIGIGGSDLGPRLICGALSVEADGPQAHFVANMDGTELHGLLRQLRPETTLFVVVSKSFCTQETLVNARHARAWMVSALGEAAVRSHFVAVSTNRKAVASFGIDPDQAFGFWDWVGGRYSLWSAVGLTAIVALGEQRFGALLSGAHAMDQHFRTAPPAENLPVLMGLIGVWNTNFLGCNSQLLVPYAQRLSRLVGWAQQLELESNGKGVDRAGHSVDHATTPVLWGHVGTNAQHAFFQMLHQGPAVHAIDFVLPLAVEHPYPDMHRQLVANCFAQSAALMRGKSAAEVRVELEAQGLAGEELDAAIPHRVCPGNRPSNTLLLPRLDAFHLGALLALYEHRTYVQSLLWGINAFDQWGVELGKQLAGQLLDEQMCVVQDASTIELLRRAGF